MSAILGSIGSLISRGVDKVGTFAQNRCGEGNPYAAHALVYTNALQLLGKASSFAAYTPLRAVDGGVGIFRAVVGLTVLPAQIKAFWAGERSFDGVGQKVAASRWEAFRDLALGGVICVNSLVYVRAIEEGTISGAVGRIPYLGRYLVRYFSVAVEGSLIWRSTIAVIEALGRRNTELAKLQPPAPPAATESSGATVAAAAAAAAPARTLKADELKIVADASQAILGHSFMVIGSVLRLSSHFNVVSQSNPFVSGAIQLSNAVAACLTGPQLAIRA